MRLTRRDRQWATQELFKMVKERTYRPDGRRSGRFGRRLKIGEDPVANRMGERQDTEKALDRIDGYWAEHMGVTDRKKSNAKFAYRPKSYIHAHLNMALAVVKKKDFNDIVTNEEGRAISSFGMSWSKGKSLTKKVLSG